MSSKSARIGRSDRAAPRRPRSSRGVAGLPALLALALALLGCGKEVPYGGARPASPVDVAKAPRIDKRVDPVDVLPADLDLVVRLDLARMRAQLGPTAAEQLPARAIDDPGEALLLGAIEKGDVVWLGLRLGEIEHGDRVVVVEGRFSGFVPDAAEWRPVASANREVHIYDRAAGAVMRSRTARILDLGDRALAFVSPVEVDSVTRVLRRGADAKRGDPRAEGLVSVDLRARRLPHDLERRFPSFAAIVAGLERVRATAVLEDGGLTVDAEILGDSAASAERARKFLDVVRESLGRGRYAGLARGADVETVERTVRVRAVVPREILLGALGGEGAPAADAPAPKR